MMVEGKELEILTQDSSLLCSCFIILENAIIYVSKHSELDAKSSGTVAFICWCLVRYRNMLCTLQQMLRAWSCF